MVRRKVLGVALAVLGAVAMASNAFAGSTTVSGTTLTWPDYALGAPGTGTPLLSCEPASSPANAITFTGVPEGATITLNFGWFDPNGTGAPTIQPAMGFSNVAGGTLVVPVPYPVDSSTWPGFNTTTNERSIGLVVFSVVTSNATNTKLASGKWWVKCTPPPPPPPDEGEPGGCTPGFWKQQHHLKFWTNYEPAEDYNVVFGVTASFNPHTLLSALWVGGGGERALARHAVAALLNAARTDMSFTFSQAEVISGVQAAYASGDFETFKNKLDAANNTGCTLKDRDDDDDDHGDGDDHIGHGKCKSDGSHWGHSNDGYKSDEDKSKGDNGWGNRKDGDKDLEGKGRGSRRSRGRW